MTPEMLELLKQINTKLGKMLHALRYGLDTRQSSAAIKRASSTRLREGGL